MMLALRGASEKKAPGKNCTPPPVQCNVGFALGAVILASLASAGARIARGCARQLCVRGCGRGLFCFAQPGLGEPLRGVKRELVSSLSFSTFVLRTHVLE